VDKSYGFVNLDPAPLSQSAIYWITIDRTKWL